MHFSVEKISAVQDVKMMASVHGFGTFLYYKYGSKKNQKISKKHIYERQWRECTYTNVNTRCVSTFEEEKKYDGTTKISSVCFIYV